MRILWVRRGASEADAGDSIYDSKLQRALSDRFSITNCFLTRNTRPRQMMGAALSLNLPEQLHSGTPEDEQRVRALLAEHDLAIFSHEHLDRFARAMRPHTPIPFVALRQNVTSDAMASILSDRPALAGLYRAIARSQEHAALSGPLYQAITAISASDQRLLRNLSGRQDIGLVMPGAPSTVALNDTAAPVRELVVSGSYDWFPKARDVRRFVKEYAPLRDGAKVFCAAGIPSTLATQLGATGVKAYDASAAIRFGVITDRFTAGHKLKTAAYLMENCAVISFARVSEDYDFPNARNWIFEVRHAGEIDAIMDRVLSRPAAEARAELAALKEAVSRTLNWNTQAASLESVINKVRS